MYEWHFEAISISIFNFAFIICWRIFHVKFQWTIKNGYVICLRQKKDAFMQNSVKFPQSKDRSAVDVGRGTEINVSKMTANANHLKGRATARLWKLLDFHYLRKCE